MLVSTFLIIGPCTNKDSCLLYSTFSCYSMGSLSGLYPQACINKIYKGKQWATQMTSFQKRNHGLTHQLKYCILLEYLIYLIESRMHTQLNVGEKKNNLTQAICFSYIETNEARQRIKILQNVKCCNSIIFPLSMDSIHSIT